jgi:hypothetical protein
MGLFDRFRSRRPHFGGAHPDSLEAELKQWRIVKANNEASGDVAVFRIRMSKPARPDIDRLATAVVIKWPYVGGRVPSTDVNQLQLAFEQALDPLSTEGESELVQVTTGMNLKEWIYYTQSSDAFTVRLNELLSGHPRYPIEIEFYKDPEWRVWGDTVDSLKARGV